MAAHHSWLDRAIDGMFAVDSATAVASSAAALAINDFMTGICTIRKPGISDLAPKEDFRRLLKRRLAIPRVL